MGTKIYDRYMTTETLHIDIEPGVRTLFSECIGLRMNYILDPVDYP